MILLLWRSSRAKKMPMASRGSTRATRAMDFKHGCVRAPSLRARGMRAARSLEQINDITILDCQERKELLEHWIHDLLTSRQRAFVNACDRYQELTKAMANINVGQDLRILLCSCI